MKKRIGLALALAISAAVIFFYTQNGFNNGWEQVNRKLPPEYSDPSKPIKTTVGQEFTITLDSNRTTGYGWQFAGEIDKEKLKIVEIQHQSSKTKRLGAGGKDMWTFRALQKGNASISLEYVRPWEKDVAPAKEATFTVMVE